MTAEAAGRALRQEALPDGRILEVRLMRQTDIDALAALYDRLSDDDRRRRFFSPFHPNRAFLERWVRLSERGGCGIVAAVRRTGDDGGDPTADRGGAASEELVGEAGFAPLPNGNAELALTIVDGWRGWLGPYLLDLLVEQAAAHGIEALEAEVLAGNLPMLAMLRGRGAAVAGQPDWTSLRLVIGTAQRTPSWPPNHDRPRVLVEGAGMRWTGAAAATDAGFDVITCPGPGRGRPRCPLLEGGTCPLIEGSDAIVVVVGSGPEDLGSRLAEAMAGRDTTTPVVVDVRGATPPPVLPRTSRVYVGSHSPDVITSAVREALDATGGAS
jgi:hypothetical protein